jgi:large subunit ribosomal protein L9e
MRMVHAHFPINVIVPKDGKSVEVKNFLGGRHVAKIVLNAGCKASVSPFVKDEIIFDGIDNAALSQSCAVITQSCRIGRKDDRKFLDGVYVQTKGQQVEDL